MASINLICNKIWFAIKKLKKVIVTDKTLQKSHEILKIRQNYGLKYKNIILPPNISDTEGYHVTYYKNFLAVMKKYYKLIGAQHQHHPTYLHMNQVL